MSGGRTGPTGRRDEATRIRPIGLRRAARIPPTASLILSHDVAQDIRDVLAVVRRLFEPFGDLLELDDADGVSFFEQGRHRSVHQVIRQVFETVNLKGDSLDLAPVLPVVNHAYGLKEESRRLGNRVAQEDHRIGRAIDPVQQEAVRRGIDHVEDVVLATCERLDILAVDWRNERLVQFFENAVGDVVPSVLDVLDLPPLRRDVLEVTQQFLEGESAIVDGRRQVFQQVKETPLLRDVPLFQPHTAISPYDAVVSNPY